MEHPNRGRPRQDGGLTHVDRDKRLQQYLQGQKGNDLALARTPSRRGG